MANRELEYVCCLAEHRSITQAAKALGLTQPALSIFLRNLETRLNIKLFEHVGKTLVLTYAGERYVHYAREMMLMDRAMAEELSELRAEDNGQLSLTCMLPRSTYIVPQTIPAFKRMYSNVSIQLYEELSYETLEKNILEGRAFLGIGNFQSTSPSITSVPLTEEEMLLALSADHPLARKLGVRPGDPPRMVDLDELEDTPLIVPRDTRTAEAQHTVFNKQKHRHPVFLETKNIENSLRLCAEGFGVTFLCSTHIHFPYLPENLVFLSTNEPDARFMLYLLHRTNAYIPSYIQSYITLLQQYAEGKL